MKNQMKRSIHTLPIRIVPSFTNSLIMVIPLLLLVTEFIKIEPLLPSKLSYIVLLSFTASQKTLTALYFQSHLMYVMVATSLDNAGGQNSFTMLQLQTMSIVRHCLFNEPTLK